MTSAMPNKTKAVFDSSPLVFLDALGYTDHIENLHEAFIPPDVTAELTLYPERSGAGAPALPWITERSPSPTNLQRVKRELAAGAGEQAAIALALDLSALVVTDDAKARRYVSKLGMRLTGTLGILVRLHLLGWATRTIDEDLGVLEQNNMHMSEELRDQIISKINKR